MLRVDVWRVLIGRPLRSSEAAQEEIGPVEGLSALSLDALTSVAYGPQALLMALAPAGLIALGLAPWITIAIVGLLALLVLSYIQVIDAYPGGGGAYAVARANLGTGVSLLAGASLIIDYTLTVAVSIAAGVAALTSAFQPLVPLTIPLCVVILAVITLLNLRGLGDGARAFLLPTIVFIVGILVTIAIGLIHPLAPDLQPAGRSLVPTHALAAVDLLLLLKAFSAGCSALTGVEAIANGVPLFRHPRQHRAKQTEVLLGVLLAAMLLGLAILVQRFQVVPRENHTVLSQVMAHALTPGWAYAGLSIVITIVLALAANTSFGGLPVLASLLARDNHLPHSLAIRGDRLVFTNGIWLLAVLAGLILVVSRGNTDALIPLFAVGVFTGFTLAQAGLVRHWWTARPPGWQSRAFLNGLGAFASGASALIFVITKFTEGAWIVVVAVPLLIYLFIRIRRYYEAVGKLMGLDGIPARPAAIKRHTVAVVPATDVSKVVGEALSFGKGMADEVVAVTVVFDDDPDRAARLEQRWKRWDPGVRLVTLHSDYHSIEGPFVDYVRSLKKKSDCQIIVLIPVVVPEKLRYQPLHNHLDVVLSQALRGEPDVIVARVPFSLRIDDRDDGAPA